MPAKRKTKGNTRPKGQENKGRRRRRGDEEAPVRRAPMYKRKRGRNTSAANNELLNLLKPSEQDVMKLLAAQVHIGRRKCHTNIKRYIWKRRQDGVHIINLEKTWAKLVLAARILVTVRDPADVAVMSTRTFGQRGAIKFAHYTGATPMVGKWVPGTFTNPRNKRAFTEPRVLIVDDPNTCFAALRETSYTGIPVIALMGTDNNSRFVDCGIPCNNRGKYSIGLMFWLLTREVLRMRGKSDYDCIRQQPWKESVDLFFYRDADEIKKQQDRKERKARRKAAREAAKMADYGGQQQTNNMDYAQPVDEYQDDQQQPAGGYADDQMQQPMDDGYGAMGQGGYAMPQGQDDWDMPQGQEIEDWDQQDQYGAPQQQQPPMDDQGAYDQYAEPPPQVDQGFVEQDQSAMGMQNW